MSGEFWHYDKEGMWRPPHENWVRRLLRWLFSRRWTYHTGSPSFTTSDSLSSSEKWFDPRSKQGRQW